MKNFIKRINNYFLERFPLLWNTRIYWVLPICIITHLLFFIVGHFTSSDLDILVGTSIDDLVFENGTLLFGAVVSILIIITWLTVLLRNNAFKSFYPTSAGSLFKSFLLYFIILFTSTTFYLSYLEGYKNNVLNTYPQDWLTKTVEKANLAGAFLNFSPDNYSINNKRYPSPFDTLYCETRPEFIDISKPFLEDDYKRYQFYSVKKNRVSSHPGTLEEPSFSDTRITIDYINDSIKEYVTKGAVADVSGIINTAPSVYNYSTPKFGTEAYYRYPGPEEASLNSYSNGSVELNKSLYELLKRNNREEIRKLFSDVLSLAKKFDAKTNLTEDKWLQMAYRPNDFPPPEVMLNADNNREPVAMADTAVTPLNDAAAATVKESANDAWKTAGAEDDSSIKKDIIKHPKIPIADTQDSAKPLNYFDAQQIQAVFSKINAVHEFSIFQIYIHVAIWIAFALTALLFAFRITNIQTLIFSGITVAVLTILVVLIALMFNLTGGNDDVLVICYIIFVLGTAVLLGSLITSGKIKKMVQGVLINITVGGIVLYFLLILGIISLHQELSARYLQSTTGRYQSQDNILGLLEEKWSYVLLIAGFIFMYFYCFLIRKWRALPDK